jgi:hypothetical protein
MNDKPVQKSAEGEDDDVIEIAVPFAAMKCPNCDVPREPGPCPECGNEVPAPEIDEQANARARAFRPLVERLMEIRDRFDEIGEGEIPLTPDQFLQAMNETDIYERAGQMAKVGGELSGLDLADHKVVGGAARKIVAAHLDRVEQLLTRCEEIGRFRAEPPADELRALAIEAGCFGVDIASALVGAVAAQSFDEARREAARAQKLLTGFPLGDAISLALEKLEPVAVPDLNRRLALALGGEGDFIDEDGNLDISRILTGFADEEEPLAVLAERAETYFAYLIDGHSQGDGSGAILLPSLALVAASDRPLRTHSAAWLLKERLSRATHADKTATRVLVDRTTAQGALIYTALSRVERAVGKLGDDSEAEHAIDQVMSAYKNLAETTFRTIGWLSTSLDMIIDGKEIPVEEHPPMLGELCHRLARGSALSKLLAESVDPGLRNAEAHSQYQWIASREVVKDLRTKQEWTVDEISEALIVLSSCLAGADAGYACFVVSGGMPGELPDWLHEDETPIVFEMLATLCFAPYGHEIETVEDRGGTVILRKAGSRDPARLIPPLGGMGTFADAETFSVRTVEGDVLVEVGANEVRAAITAKSVFKDLSLLNLAYENSRGGAADSERVDDEFAAFAAKVIGVSGLRALTAGNFGPGVLNDLRDRVNWGANFLKRLDTDKVDLGALQKRLLRIRDSLSKASRGTSGSIESLATRLTNLAEWAEETGFSWPPK